MLILSDTVSPKETTAFRLDSELLAAMRRVKQVEGIPVTTQVEMAAREWLKKRGVIVKADRKRASTRKRP
jgi:hypothetical protein